MYVLIKFCADKKEGNHGQRRLPKQLKHGWVFRQCGWRYKGRFNDSTIENLFDVRSIKRTLQFKQLLILTSFFMKKNYFFE